MSRWGRDWSSYSKGPKATPPEHGIKIKKLGTTWWGQRWIEALEQVLGGDAGRLARGRTYARAGRTHDLVIKGGEVSAMVTGSRPDPYEITISLTQLPAPAWHKAIAVMAGQARFSAELLAGQMPKEIDEAFREGGMSLFPGTRRDLQTSCSCPDDGDPCKHVAATHYVLGEALDRDPFLLFELRGRTKEQVLSELRLARGGEKAAAAKREPENRVATVQLKKGSAADYDRAPEALPALTFSFDAQLTHGAVLRQLGVPSGWANKQSPADALSPLVRGAAEAARRIALGETAEPTPEPLKTSRRGTRR